MARTRAGFLFLLLLASVSASAQSASGDFTFALPGASGAIQFNAKTSGNAPKGHISFTATQQVSNDAVDDSGGPGTSSQTATIGVTVDCLKVTGNRAAMSGVVTSSSVPGYVGLRAILAVEDGGEGSKAPRDGFTWGVYGNNAATWTPSDAEVPGDNGAMFSWLATDFEVPGDAGIQVGANAPTGVTCQSFGLAAYTLDEVAHGAGNIQVRQ
ncbi:MAG TPA: hypothetical protein VEO54_14545 [Thermoanaerobaculia bacterium]|nr:hypothetical protein [Thermoanaerobaculia bacterium]